MTTDFHREPAYGAQMATYFRLPKASSLVIQPVAKAPIAITRLVSETGVAERSESIPVERAFVVSMHLTPASSEGCEIWVDYHHSRETFDAFTDENEVSRIESLDVLHGTVDPVLHQLTQLILPSLTRPQA